MIYLKMSNVKLISERKKIKKENNVWNDRFFLGKMEDYAKKNNVNSNYMTKFKIKGSEQYKKKLYLNKLLTKKQFPIIMKIKFIK